jgi:hypothetical protein
VVVEAGVAASAVWKVSSIAQRSFGVRGALLIAKVVVQLTRRSANLGALDNLRLAYR